MAAELEEMNLPTICSRLRHHRAVGAALAAVLAASSSLAVVGGSPVPTDDHALDGVGLLLTVQPWNPCGGWVSGTCTLVAPDLVLLARHSVQLEDNSLPPPQERTHRVRFRRAINGEATNHFSGNSWNCESPFQEIYISEFISAPSNGVDMLLGRLETAVVGIDPIGVDLELQPASDLPVVLAGWGFDGRCMQSGDAWTLRTSAGVLPPITDASSCCFLYNNVGFHESCMTWPQDAHWIVANLHDSGAPILVQSAARGGRPAELRILGIVSDYSRAKRVGLWNLAGGQPVLAEPAARCLAEFDGQPGINVSDAAAYIQAWLNRDARADIDGTSGVSLSDLMLFIQHYFVGC